VASGQSPRPPCSLPRFAAPIVGRPHQDEPLRPSRRLAHEPGRRRPTILISAVLPAKRQRIARRTAFHGEGRGQRSHHDAVGGSGAWGTGVKIHPGPAARCPPGKPHCGHRGDGPRRASHGLARGRGPSHDRAPAAAPDPQAHARKPNPPSDPAAHPRTDPRSRRATRPRPTPRPPRPGPDPESPRPAPTHPRQRGRPAATQSVFPPPTGPGGPDHRPDAGHRPRSLACRRLVPSRALPTSRPVPRRRSSPSETTVRPAPGSPPAGWPSSVGTDQNGGYPSSGGHGPARTVPGQEPVTAAKRAALGSGRGDPRDDRPPTAPAFPGARGSRPEPWSTTTGGRDPPRWALGLFGRKTPGTTTRPTRVFLATRRGGGASGPMPPGVAYPAFRARG